MQGDRQDQLQRQGEACRQLDRELAAYLEGEARAGVESHARECPYCGALLADLELIRSECRGLPAEAPPAWLWANIRARLAQEGLVREEAAGAASWFSWLRFEEFAAPAGALAALTLVAAMFLASPSALEENRAAALLPAGRPQAAPVKIAPATNVAVLETVVEMEKNYRAQQAALEPALKAVYEKTLNSLNASIRECSDSVEREPTNTLAQEYLMTAYVQKAEVLESALQEGR